MPEIAVDYGERKQVADFVRLLKEFAAPLSLEARQVLLIETMRTLKDAADSLKKGK